MADGSAMPWSCWNWVDTATGAGRGEAAIVAAQVRAVRRRYRVHPRRVFVAGFSSGGRSTRSVEYRDGKRLIARATSVKGLGHAWSGGDPAFPFNDPAPPDATHELGRFVEMQSRPSWKS
jgi:poly(3-hydroxybutyrate) depolymerase